MVIQKEIFLLWQKSKKTLHIFNLYNTKACNQKLRNIVWTQS